MIALTPDLVYDRPGPLTSFQTAVLGWTNRVSPRLCVETHLIAKSDKEDVWTISRYLEIK